MHKIEIRTCKYCGETVPGRIIGALGHTGDIWICSVCGKQTNTLTSNLQKK